MLSRCDLCGGHETTIGRHDMQHIRYVAKAITAVITTGLATAAALNLDLHPAVLVAGAAIVAGLAVFLVPNSEG